MNTRHLALLATIAIATSAFANVADNPAETNARRNASGSPSTLFALLDLDRDGVLSAAEQTYASITLSALDVDGDGLITSAELSGPVRTNDSRRSQSVARAQLVGYRPLSDLNLIVQLDANQDGVLQPIEIANAASSLRELDVNHDGVLTRSEVMLREQA